VEDKMAVLAEFVVEDRTVVEDTMDTIAVAAVDNFAVEDRMAVIVAGKSVAVVEAHIVEDKSAIVAQVLARMLALLALQW
jgi:hypothetical protein